MKILLFTHKIDIDGMGCAVLAKLAFDDIEVVYCDTFEINQQIQRYIDNSSIYQYDKISYGIYTGNTVSSDNIPAEESTGIIKVVVPDNTSITHFRLSCYGRGADLIVTVNEEIG